MNAPIAERWKTHRTAYEAGQKGLADLEERRAPVARPLPRIAGAVSVLRQVRHAARPPVRPQMRRAAEDAGAPPGAPTAPAVTTRAG